MPVTPRHGLRTPPGSAGARPPIDTTRRIRRAAPHRAIGGGDPNGRPPWWTPADPRRWGLGDVGYGLLVAIGAQTVVGVMLVLLGVTGSGDLDLPPWGILLSVAAGWLGFIGWPVLASYVKGQRSLALDFGLRFQPVDLGWGVLGGLTVLAFTIALNLFWVVVTGDTRPGQLRVPARVAVAAGRARACSSPSP